MIRKLIAVVLVIVFSLVAVRYTGQMTTSRIAVDLWENPRPLPDYVVSAPSYVRQHMCLSIYGWFFSGDAADARVTSFDIDLADLQHEMRFAVDGREVPAPVGTDWYTADGCFDMRFLPPGLHVATVNLESLTGRPESYSWAFRVNGLLLLNEDESMVELPDFPPES